MSYYNKKDEDKFAICNKLISRGVKGSSSWRYAKYGIGHIKPEMINCGIYNESDVVGISVNGMRKNRLSFDVSEVMKAIEAKSTIVIDNDYHANRSYNIGERELRQLLIKNNYVKINNNKLRSVWVYKDKARS